MLQPDILHPLAAVEGFFDNGPTAQINHSYPNGRAAPAGFIVGIV